MKRILILLLLSVSIVLAGAESTPKPGPFGFERGMTKEQIISMLGRESVKKDHGDILAVNTAPKPHPDFEYYMLLISPTEGLLKVLASGRNISSDAFGDEVHSAFMEKQGALSVAYGPATSSRDLVLAGSRWNGPEDWMMGLLKKERILTSYWELTARLGIGIQPNVYELRNGADDEGARSTVARHGEEDHLVASSRDHRSQRTHDLALAGATGRARL